MTFHDGYMMAFSLNTVKKISLGLILYLLFWHVSGVTMDDEDDEVLHSRAGSSFSPVFPTQVLDDAAEASRKEQGLYKMVTIHPSVLSFHPF